MAKTVVDLQKQTFVVRVMNLSDGERVVCKGTEVACCESARDGPNKKEDVSLCDQIAESLDNTQKEKLHALLLEYFFTPVLNLTRDNLVDD